MDGRHAQLSQRLTRPDRGAALLVTD